jgi:hypothetical protein
MKWIRRRQLGDKFEIPLYASGVLAVIMVPAREFSSMVTSAVYPIQRSD